MKWILRSTLFASLFLGYALSAWADSQDSRRYLAVFVDGRRVHGKSINSWHDEKSKPRLDSTNLADPNHRLRWLRDLQQADEEPRPIESYVEFMGGDRLPGSVVGYAASGAALEGAGFQHPHLYVDPAISVRYPKFSWPESVRVLTRWVRRVVWQDQGRTALQPGTLFFRDGRALAFRSLRWGNGNVHVLADSGAERVPFNDIAELHLPAIDPWDAYLESLGLLSPELKSRLIRMETSDGLIATVSEQRLRPAHHGSPSDVKDWYPWIQPAWSLDLLAIHFPTIHTWSFYHPEEVPLTWFAPVASRQRSLAGGHWRPRTDRNVQGGPLRSGGQRHGWGLGVHAFSEVEYELSPLVEQVSAKIGLDRLAGAGGCARARIFFNSTDSSPAFESKHLIGSNAGVSTGGVAVPQADGKPVRMILQADPASKDRPAGSDPLDIRDSLDWLEPLLKLRVEPLREEVAARRSWTMPAWVGWHVDVANVEKYELGSYWAHWGVARYGFHQATYGKGELRLSRRLQVGPDDNWLVLGLYREDLNNHDKIIIRIDGETIAERSIPFTYDKDWVDPLSVPINAYQGKEIELTIVRKSSHEHAAVVWNFIELRSEAPYLYRILEEGRRELRLPDGEAARVQLTDADCYSGRKCVEIASGPKPVGVETPVLKIREKPGMGEFRYLRFAVRKEGAGRAYVELDHAAREERPFRFDAGTGEPVGGQAVRIWPHEKMDQWVVITRDLFHDFGAFDLQGVELGMTAEGTARFDHVYLAQKQEDLDDAIAERKLAPGEANILAAKKLFEGTKEKAAPSLVRVQVGNRQGGGVIISREGLILTTAFLAGRPDQVATVRLADGREFKGKTMGMHRQRDISFVQLDETEDELDLPRIERASSDDYGPGSLVMALAFSDSDWKSNTLGSAIVKVHGKVDYLKWVSLAFRREYTGGVLVDGQGRLVGVLSRGARLGGTLCPTILSVKSHGDQLKRKQVVEDWALPLTPTTGAVIGTAGEGFTVLDVAAGSPAAKAGLQVGDRIVKVDDQPVVGVQTVLEAFAAKLVGDQVAFELLRDGEPKTVSVELVSRQ